MGDEISRDERYAALLGAAMRRGAAPAALALPGAEAAPWFAVQAAPRMEWVAFRELAGRGLPTFLPHAPGTRRHGRRVIGVSVPLFAGYLFARVSDGAFEAVRKADGVAGIVRVAERYAAVPDAVVAALMAACDDRGCLRVVPEAARSGVAWAVGEIARIVAGPFEGFDGPVTAVDSHGRIALHIDIFGRPTPVTVSSEDISKQTSVSRQRPRQKRR